MKNIRFFQPLFLLVTFCIALQFSASAQWLQDPVTQDIFTNPLFIGMPNAKVKIGNPPPAVAAKLTVECNSAVGFPALDLHNNTANGSLLRFTNMNAGFWDIAGTIDPINANDRLNFKHDVIGTIMSLTGAGYVGIGTTAPTQKLHVNGTTRTTGLQVTNGAVNGYFLKTDAAGNASWAKPSWTTSGNNQYSSLTGNVGIGTSTPTAKLSIAGTVTPLLDLKSTNTSWGTLQFTNNNTGLWNIKALVASNSLDDRLNFENDFGGTIMSLGGNGRVGIGEGNPRAKLSIVGTETLSSPLLELKCNASDWSTIQFTNTNSGNWNIKGLVATSSTSDLLKFENDAAGTIMTMTGEGNVGIGTISPDNKLDVCGTIRAKEVKVESGWCDYVFEENYTLRPLAEVEKYIVEHRHLPDVTSAADIQKDGLQVAKQMTEMMRKIEELTLYLIEMKKENTETKKENEALRLRLEKLEN